MRLALLFMVASATDAQRAVEVASPAVPRVEARGRPLAPELDSLLRSVGASWRGSRAQRGAGVVVDVEGRTLTNAHVVAGAHTVSLTWPDGTSSDARVRAMDADLDLAWLDPIQTTPRQPAVWRPELPPVGSPVFTLGFPTGPEQVVSAGILSGTTERGLQGRSRRTYLLTDALVQRGASGGPLVDPQGRVLGISTGGFAGDSDGLGLGLVLPGSDVQSRLAAWGRQAPRQGRVRCAATPRGLALSGALEATVTRAGHDQLPTCRSLARAIQENPELLLTADDALHTLHTASPIFGEFVFGDTVEHVSTEAHALGFDVGDVVESHEPDARAVRVRDKGWLLLPDLP